MRAWHEVSRRTPCPVCSKPDWCSVSADGAWAICRRLETGAGVHRLDKAGADYWVYRLDGQRLGTRPAREVPPQTATTCADTATLNRVYRALLTARPLSTAHRQALRQRGLSDTEMARRGYRTLARHGRAALARRLVDHFGADICAQIPGLYVVERGGQRWWSLAGAPGLLIPVRDVDGRMVALKVRADAPGDGPRYTTVSSAKHGGPGPGASVHVPLHDGVHDDTVRVTEGELKADVATALSGMLTMAIPGIAMWRKALPVLHALTPQQVRLSVDADWRTNPHVGRALAQSAFALVDAGYLVLVEVWDPVQGKGIDDVLAAGHLPTLHTPALAFGAGVQARARVWTEGLRTIGAEEVPPWH